MGDLEGCEITLIFFLVEAVNADLIITCSFAAEMDTFEWAGLSTWASVWYSSMKIGLMGLILIMHLNLEKKDCRILKKKKDSSERKR
jgi:hypothetical protein